MGTIYRGIYCSRSNLAGVDDEAYRTEVAEILEVSRRNNLRDGLTGALLFSRGSFAQALEGPLIVVKAKLERIERDVRHSHFKLLEIGPVPARDFPNWSMAFSGVSGAEHTVVDRMFEHAELDPTEASNELTAFLKLSAWQAAGMMAAGR